MAIKVVNNTRKVFSNITDKKAPMFLNGVLDVIDQHATFKAPVAYSKLVNSKFRNVTNSAGRGWQGTFGFLASYALPLNGDGTYKPSWKPKPPPKYGNAKKGISPAPAWNPRAKPRFLTDALSNPEAKADIQKLYDIFRK